MKPITIFFLLLAVNCYGQLKGLARTAKDAAEAAELAAIAVDVIESTSFTLEKLETCKNELKELEDLMDDVKIRKYLSNDRHRVWADQVRTVSMNVKLYATLVSSALKRLTTMKTGLIADKAANVLESVGQMMGGGNQAAQPVVEAVDKVESGIQKANVEQTLVSILLKLDTFNRDIDELVEETNGISESISAELGFAVLMSLPGTTITDYANRKKLNKTY